MRGVRVRRGWPIVVIFSALVASYLIIGSVYNMQTKQVTGLASLPHPEFWKAGYNLVVDGAYYTRSRLRGGVDGGGAYDKLPAAVSGSDDRQDGADAPAGQRLEEAQAALRPSGSSSSGGKTKTSAEGSSSRGRSKEKKGKKEKRSKSSRKDESSEEKSKSRSKSKGKSKSSTLRLEDKGIAVTEQLQESGGADGFSAAVREERDSQVHSSMAKLKVVSLSSTL
eukprot:COSAG02_NODE_80_length_40128_cov_591.169002_22_plen_224_part_00